MRSAKRVSRSTRSKPATRPKPVRRELSPWAKAIIKGEKPSEETSFSRDWAGHAAHLSLIGGDPGLVLSSRPSPQALLSHEIKKQKKKNDGLLKDLLTQLERDFERHSAGKKRRRTAPETKAERAHRLTNEANRKHFKRILYALHAAGIVPRCGTKLVLLEIADPDKTSQLWSRVQQKA